MKKYPSKARMNFYHLQSFFICILLIACSLHLFLQSSRFNDLISDWERGRASYTGCCEKIIRRNFSRYRTSHYIFILDNGTVISRSRSDLLDAGFIESELDKYTSNELCFYYTPFPNNPFTRHAQLLGIEDGEHPLIDEEFIYRQAEGSKKTCLVFGIILLPFILISAWYFGAVSIHHIFPNLKPRYRKIKKRLYKKLHQR